MAPGGLLHVTVVSANLLNATDGGSDSATDDAYAAVVCGSHQFTTNTVTNHETRPSWNESHTFQFEEYNELEAQHILVEIFAEKPRLDELLGLAKIPLSKVIASGDETSVHSLNRPDDVYSGHVKVSMKWDSKQLKVTAAKSAYPEAFVPCARYDPNASTAKPPSLVVDGQARRGSSGDMSQQQDEDGAHDTPERRAHQRSSSYPSRAYNFSSGYSPAASPSNSNLGHQPKGSYDGSYPPASQGYPPRSPGHPSNHSSQSPGQQPPISPGSHHNGYTPHSPGSHGFSSNGHPVEPQQSPREPGPVGAGQNGRGSAPHVPYVANQGQQTGVIGGHVSYQKRGAGEADPANLDPKLPDDLPTSKMSKSRQAEMAKLAELSRLTESAKYLSTGFAQPQHGREPQQVPAPRGRNDTIPPQQQQIQATPRPRNDVLPSQQQQLQGSTKARNDIIPSQQHQQVQNSSKPRSDMIPTQQQQLQISSKARNEIVPSHHQQPQGARQNNPIISQQQQFQSTSRPNNHVIPSQQQQLHASARPRHEAAATPQVAQATPPRSITVFQGPVYDGVQQKSQNEAQNPRAQQRSTYGLPQQMVHTPLREQHEAHDRNGNGVQQETPSNHLQIVAHRPEADKKPPHKLDKAARKAEKEAQKAAKGKEGQIGEKPERESHVSHIRQTLKMLRKTSKIFR
ncbi:hypothetical protein Mapa_005931 [Marchantia paleacea]|nr:hypothetical protein Mapa_005931 [Marchantia paleacea]